MPRMIWTILTVLTALPALPAGAQTFEFATPSGDRWFYPFNFTPGFRTSGFVFGAISIPGLNQRDAELLIAWNTSGQIPGGQAPSAYSIQSIRVTLTHTVTPRPRWTPDLTVDEWFTYDPNVPGDDTDPGSPIELFGVGFGPAYTPATWTENSPFIGGRGIVDPNDPNFTIARDPYPLGFHPDLPGLPPVHVEDSVLEQFTPVPWAIGAPVGYDPNDVNQQPFPTHFDVDLDAAGGNVRAYFQEQLAAGKVYVTITSLAPAEQASDQSFFPNFFLKESGFAPRLEIVLSAGQAGDVDGNGCVNLDDLLLVLGAFGQPGPTGDLDQDGFVDLDDLLLVLGNFGQGVCP